MPSVAIARDVVSCCFDVECLFIGGYASKECALKYFGLGFNKTGTTTLYRCFEILGFAPVASPQAFVARYRAGALQGRPGFTWRSTSPLPPLRHVAQEIIGANHYAAPLALAAEFHAFQDRPWNMGDFYKAFDQQFPRSKFVLTVRESTAWWRSADGWLKRHSDNTNKRQMYCLHLGVSEWSQAACIAAYETYNAGIREYFRGRAEDLLEINFELGDAWPQLCQFLQVPEPQEPFPHENRSSISAES